MTLLCYSPKYDIIVLWQPTQFTYASDRLEVILQLETDGITALNIDNELEIIGEL